MIYDISQPVPDCAVYPGDPKPELTQLAAIDRGDDYTLTAFSMCAHNGTHTDAPAHFIRGGKGIGAVPLEKFIGPACVIRREGELNAAAAEAILAEAETVCSSAAKRILIKGNAVISLEAARVFAAADIWLIGSESQSVGPAEEPMAVHLALLGAEAVLLEGVRLTDVPEGVYLLHAAPLNLGNADGAPCRATLMTL